MTAPLAELLRLVPQGGDRFEAPPAAQPGWTHVFGGHVAAQALGAAGATVTGDRFPHSLHAYFVRGGTREEPGMLEVERVRDGRSFSVRRVEVSHGDEVILVLDASFHVVEPGPTVPEPQLPAVPTPEERAGAPSYLHALRWLDVFEIRPVADDGGRPAQPFWVRTRERLPDDRLLHACAIASMTDIGMATAIGSDLAERGLGPTIDHCVWFHSHARADDWLLFDAGRQAVAGARGLGLGTVRTRDGRLVATIAQEVLVRTRRAAEPQGAPATETQAR